MACSTCTFGTWKSRSPGAPGSPLVLPYAECEPLLVEFLERTVRVTGDVCPDLAEMTEAHAV